MRDRNQWLVMVGDGDYGRVLQRLELAIKDAVRSGVANGRGRPLPLLAIPVVGIGLGGHSQEQGYVLRRLIEVLTSLSERWALDIALVTPELSVFAAAQYLRRRMASQLDARGEELARALGQRARDGQLALFIGAGASISAGLRSWSDLVAALTEGTEESRTGALDGLSLTDQAELIALANPDGFKARVVELMRPAERPALVHVLLAGLDIGQAVTTNYDLLYESAIRASGRRVDSVMPWQSAVGAERWVLKLHGDVEHEEQIVLTRRHMVRYDAANRPSAALLQSLLLTKHLLVVGASLTDDNVVRLAQEVQAYRELHHEDAGQWVATASPQAPSGPCSTPPAGVSVPALAFGRGSSSGCT